MWTPLQGVSTAGLCPDSIGVVEPVCSHMESDTMLMHAVLDHKSLVLATDALWHSVVAIR